MTTTTPQQHNTQEQSQAPALGERIARLKNEELLKEIKAVEALYTNINGSSFRLLLSEEQRRDLQALIKEVKEARDALNREYGTRLLRGYYSQFKQLLAALQPRQPTSQGDAAGFKVIPLRAAPTQEEQEDVKPQQEDALQAAIAVFAEQLRAIFAGSAEGQADSPAPEEAQP